MGRLLLGNGALLVCMVFYVGLLDAWFIRLEVMCLLTSLVVGPVNRT